MPITQLSLFQLDLYVDGKPIAQTEDNLEILDDWPMHAVNGMKVPKNLPIFAIQASNPFSTFSPNSW